MFPLEKSFFVVEDHTLTNLGIRQLLSQNDGFTCAGFACGAEEAFTKICQLAEENHLPELLLVDLFLGEENGLDLVRKIKEKYDGIKILIYSMYAKPGIVSLALESGVQGFVSKSAPESELLLAIEKVLSGDTYVQQNLIAPLFTFRSMIDGLTRQEQNILKKVIERKSNAQIASDLNIVPRSLENYLSRIYSKTGCRGHEELLNKYGE